MGSRGKERLSGRILKSNCVPLIGSEPHINVNTKSESEIQSSDNMPDQVCSSVLARICQMFGVDQFVSESLVSAETQREYGDSSKVVSKQWARQESQC